MPTAAVIPRRTPIRSKMSPERIAQHVGPGKERNNDAVLFAGKMGFLQDCGGENGEKARSAIDVAEQIETSSIEKAG